jgi:hypothetical protein
MRFWLNVLKFILEETLRFPPHLNPLPPGERKEKKKMRCSRPKEREGIGGKRRGGSIISKKQMGERAGR